MNDWRRLVATVLAQGEGEPASIAADKIAKIAIIAPNPNPAANSGYYDNFGIPQSTQWSIEGALTELANAPPPAADKNVWRKRMMSAAKFELDWGDTARALGWSDTDLYGMHEVRPLNRFDAMGAALFTTDSQVTEVGGDFIIVVKKPRGAVLSITRPQGPCIPVWQLYSAEDNHAITKAFKHDVTRLSAEMAAIANMSFRRTDPFG